MKKIIFAIAIVLTIGLTANAQNKQDSFLGWDDNNDRTTPDWTTGFIVPNLGLGDNDDVPAPLGSGLLVLAALGAGYAVAKKRKK